MAGETTEERWIERLEELGAAQVRLMLQFNQVPLKRQAATVAWLAAKEAATSD